LNRGLDPTIGVNAVYASKTNAKFVGQQIQLLNKNHNTITTDFITLKSAIHLLDWSQ
jgi:hypothetical protein